MSNTVKSNVKPNSAAVDAIVKALAEADKPLTLDEISAATGMTIKAGHIVSALRKGLIVKDDAEVIVERPAVKKVSTYMRGEVSVDDYLAKFPKSSFSDTTRALADALTETPETLEEISARVGTTFKSGHMTALVLKGIAAKGEEKEIPTTKKSKVSAYELVGAPSVEA